MMTHRMRRMETLEMLSARYRVPVCMIVRANEAASPKDICAGREIKIPNNGFCRQLKAQQMMAMPYKTYVVQEEDSLYSIAGKFGVTMRIITRANDLRGAVDIRAGDMLRIPDVRGKRYCVRAGESLCDIARRYGISEKRIREINGLGAGDAVHPGMQLIIG